MYARSGGGGSRTDAELLFLRVQAAWLCGGLSHMADPCAVRDPRAVRLVLAVHDRGHGTWLSLFAAVRNRGGGQALTALGELYACHGRVAGVLAGEALIPPDPGTLHDELVWRTGAAIDAIAMMATVRP